MTRRLTYIVMGVVVAIGVSQAWGQTCVRPSVSSHDQLPRRVTGVWVDPYGGYHASTAAEGYARGMAAMIYAQGQYNLATSEAAVNLAAARQQQIANRKQRIENYFAARQINQLSRNAERGARTPAPTTKAAQIATDVKRVSINPFDPATGKISWPTALQGEEYASLRLELEQLFAQRSPGSGFDATRKGQAVEAVNAMLAQLKEHVREYDCGQYVTARQFLNRLAQETRQTT